MYVNINICICIRFVILLLCNLIIRDRPRNGRAGAIISRKYFHLPSWFIAPTSGPISWRSICSCQTQLRCIMKNWSSFTSQKLSFASSNTECFKMLAPDIYCQ